MRANQACNSGLLAASAKNGRPIETANSPISQNASPIGGGRPHPAAIDSGSARHGGDHDRQMDDDRRPARGVAREQVRIGIACEQRGLEKHDRHRPHRRRAAEARQHHLGEHRLHHEQERRRSRKWRWRRSPAAKRPCRTLRSIRRPIACCRWSADRRSPCPSLIRLQRPGEIAGSRDGNDGGIRWTGACSPRRENSARPVLNAGRRR